MEVARPPWWSLRHRGRMAWTAHLALLALFAGLAVIAHALRADRPDVWVTGRIQSWHSLSGLMHVVSWLGSAPQSVAIDAGLVGGLWALRARVEAGFLLLAAGGGTLLDALVKVLVGRPRPGGPGVEVLGHVGGYSFPSGHVVNYVSLFGFLAYVSWTRLRGRRLRRTIPAVCLALILLVGPSRIYLGAHWASDVLGAYLLGGIWLSAILRAYVAWVEVPQPVGLAMIALRLSRRGRRTR